MEKKDINLKALKASGIPQVGKGATVHLHSDKHAYEVMEMVTEPKVIVRIQRVKMRCIDHAEQEYEILGLGDLRRELVLHRGHWCEKYESFGFVDPEMSYRDLTDEQKDLIFEGGTHPKNMLEGITKRIISYGRVNITFGRKVEYYDITR